MAKDGIDQLARRLAEALPQGVRNMREELEQNFRGILKTGLSRLDLVTREEFDVQQAVLARTREKLDGLEARMAGLEQPPAQHKPQSKAPGKKKAAKKKAAKKKPAKKKASKKKAAKKKAR